LNPENRMMAFPCRVTLQDQKHTSRRPSFGSVRTRMARNAGSINLRAEATSRTHRAR
jgi:hypothetical protein